MSPAGGSVHATEPPVTGPRPVDRPSDALVEAFGSLWLAVNRAGGAVGFTPDAPEAAVRVAARAAIDEVRAGRQRMLALDAGDELVGAVFLRPGAAAVVAHRGTVVKLMVHPRLHGRGWGSRLLAAVEADARRIGLEQLLLSARSGTPLPAFYAARGWVEVGRWPGSVRVGPGDDRDEVWFQLRLGDAAGNNIPENGDRRLDPG